MPRVLGFGDNVVDKYEHTKTMYPGGNCVNFAVFAKQFGAEASAYMGIFGDDREAQHVIATLSALGIETFKCKQLPGENGCARVTLIDGERVFLGSNAGGIRHEIPFILDHFDLEYIRTFDLVHSGNYSYTESELHKIKAIGVPISFDFSDDSPPEYVAALAPLVDYAFLSLGDLGNAILRQHMQRVLGYGCRLAVATRGSKGLVAYNGNRFYYQAAIHVEPVDTMGAGDSAIAAFLVSYITAKKSSNTDEAALLPECLHKAAHFAANTCLVEGAFGYGKSYL